MAGCFKWGVWQGKGERGLWRGLMPGCSGCGVGMLARAGWRCIGCLAAVLVSVSRGEKGYGGGCLGCLAAVGVEITGYGQGSC